MILATRRVGNSTRILQRPGYSRFIGIPRSRCGGELFPLILLCILIHGIYIRFLHPRHPQQGSHFTTTHPLSLRQQTPHRAKELPSHRQQLVHAAQQKHQCEAGNRLEESVPTKYPQDNDSLDWHLTYSTYYRSQIPAAVMILHHVIGPQDGTWFYVQ